MIELRQVVKHFPVKEGLLDSLSSWGGRSKRLVKAVNGISFTMERGEMVGLAGESGCGKTTTGMLLLRLYKPTSGTIFFEGRDLSLLEGKDLLDFRRRAQMVFQDPYESLNPRFTVRRTIEEPLIVHHVRNREDRHNRIVHTMERVRLTPAAAFLDKYPHELSGGERQRLCIARAVVLEPHLLVADEAVSMLDVSIRAGILRLLDELTRELDMATLYVSHDLSLLGSICRRIAIMYAGEIVEMGTPGQIVGSPLHPYSRALVAAVPVPEFDQRRQASFPVPGEPPDLMALPEGCLFRSRCPVARPSCLEERPPLKDAGAGHLVACPFPGGST